MNHPKAAEKAGLTEEDIEVMSDIEYQTRKKLIPLEGEAQLARLELGRLLDQDEPDQDAVMAAIDKVGETETAIKKVRIQSVLRIREQIGDEKIEKLKEMRRKFAQRRQGKRHGRGRQGQRGYGGRSRGPGEFEPEEEPPEDVEFPEE